MKKTKIQKGITLIALIITIIVLLILAVVAISAVQGDGIIQYAKNARTDYQAAQSNEKGFLDNYLDYIDEHTQSGGSSEEGGSTEGDGTESETRAAGLYETGTTTLKTSWADLISSGVITVSNGELTTQANIDEMTNASSEALAGDLVLPDTITSIGGYAFFCCSELKNVILPDTLTNLDEYAFCCSWFNSITIPGSVKSIPSSLFEGASASTIIFSEGVESLNSGVFYELGLEEINVYLPSTITYLGDCEAAIGTVIYHYNGTSTSWDNIEKDSERWESPRDCSYKVIFSDGTSIEVEPTEEY